MRVIKSDLVLDDDLRSKTEPGKKLLYHLCIAARKIKL